MFGTTPSTTSVSTTVANSSVFSMLVGYFSSLFGSTTKEPDQTASLTGGKNTRSKKTKKRNTAKGNTRKRNTTKRSYTE
jgi:hypothetical protein